MSRMPYRYLEEITSADEAFEATGKTPEELFTAAADATMNVMVEDIGTIRPELRRQVTLRDDRVDMLLFQYLQEIIYFKDAEQLLLRSGGVEIRSGESGATGIKSGGHGSQYLLSGELVGERLDAARHDLRVDVKAVTLHRFSVEKCGNGWRAVVVLDV